MFFRNANRIKAILEFLKLDDKDIKELTLFKDLTDKQKSIYDVITEGDICYWLAERGRGLYFDYEYPSDWYWDDQISAISKCFPHDEFKFVKDGDFGGAGGLLECILFGEKHKLKVVGPDSLISNVNKISKKKHGKEFVAISPDVVEYCYLLISSKDTERAKKEFGAKTL